jgi:hypothetical protein
MAHVPRQKADRLIAHSPGADSAVGPGYGRLGCLLWALGFGPWAVGLKAEPAAPHCGHWRSPCILQYTL